MVDFFYSNQLRYRISRHLLYWLSFNLFLAFIWGSTGESYQIHLTVQALLWPARIFVVYGTLYVLIPKFFLKRNLFVFGISYIIWLLLVTIFVQRTVWQYSRSFFFPDWKNYDMFNVTEIMGNVFDLNLAAVFPLVFVFVKFYNAEQKKYLTLEREQYKSELNQLRNQIHPHFLFNTLNNLYSLILKKSDEAEDALIRLSGLMRYMLYEANVPKVPLSKEIEYLRNYIDLEKLRLNASNTIHFTSSMNKDQEIAPFILMPFVENAFKHGISNDKVSTIEISIIANKDLLTMTVYNTKKINANQDNGEKTGVGLVNVQKRLELLYKDNYEMIRNETESHYKMELTLNLI
ncbi:histidine kinase [Aquimarina sp. MMG016]|uniref:sensor histidine kinase n=1 Tax=Aquimarina sp. MMG016 TaxID=2822690 RepID=UPI001B3A0409|nr:histidine kinase [Aquimarina sp. MMG016]MBQ4819592.1 histidine kinase [Aquimarina sp. MMG016]